MQHAHRPNFETTRPVSRARLTNSILDSTSHLPARVKNKVRKNPGRKAVRGGREEGLNISSTFNGYFLPTRVLCVNNQRQSPRLSNLQSRSRNSPFSPSKRTIYLSLFGEHGTPSSRPSLVSCSTLPGLPNSQLDSHEITQQFCLVGDSLRDLGVG